MIALHEGRPRLRLDGAWRYRLEGDEHGESLGYHLADLDAGSWAEMELPTNWYLTEVGDFFGTIWFRRTFDVPADLVGGRLALRFGAVDYVADVWLNGIHLGSHEGMFNPFEFDVTDHLDLDGPNVLVVKDAAPRDPTEYVEVGPTDGPLSPPYRTHQARAIAQIKGHMIDAMHRPGADDVVPLRREHRRHLGSRRSDRAPRRARRAREAVHEDRPAEGPAGRRPRPARRLRARQRRGGREQHDRRGRDDGPPAHRDAAHVRGRGRGPEPARDAPARTDHAHDRRDRGRRPALVDLGPRRPRSVPRDRLGRTTTPSTRSSASARSSATRRPGSGR